MTSQNATNATTAVKQHLKDAWLFAALASLADGQGDLDTAAKHAIRAWIQCEEAVKIAESEHLEGVAELEATERMFAEASELAVLASSS